ncbi:MFS transporter [Acidipropionibacterium timonense]|uniref:MFS transporter n=1 Tax=Acidipropionibacterium timonense TaxID=2161818 RepID=UPI002477D271|nr:MFS transporter [Acidipropionibacterium timonense]
MAAPFTAALMQAVGVSRTVAWSLGIVAVASALVCVISQPWQLWVLWGVFIGVGTGSLALTFGTIMANRWFVAHRGMVTGVFSAATAAGQVVFVPVVADVTAAHGWRVATFLTAACAGVAALLCALFLRDRPADVGELPVGGTTADAQAADADLVGAGAALTTLWASSRRWPFWVLMGTFFVCGWSTNGVVVTHLAPAAHDHMMAPTTAASLIGVIGIFDVVGTIISGWLTDRFDPRALLTVYYLSRGASLCFINAILGPHVTTPLWVFVVFYGLDWTATVPPTVELCRRHFGLRDSGVVFGWIYASHMVGAGIGASVSGVLRAHEGTYAAAWLLAAALCGVAGVLAMTIWAWPGGGGERERVLVDAGPDVIGTPPEAGVLHDVHD